MIFAIFIYAAFIAVIAHRIYTNFRRRNPETIGQFLSQNARPVSVLLIIAVSVLCINIFVGNTPVRQENLSYETIAKIPDGAHRHIALQKQALSDQPDPRVLYDYIEKDPYPIRAFDLKKNLTDHILNGTEQQKDIGRIFLYALEYQVSKEDAKIGYLHSVQNQNQPFLNLYYGRHLESQYKIKAAMDYYRAEMNIGGATTDAAFHIIDLTSKYYPDQFDSLYYDLQIAPHLDLRSRFQFYFIHGDWNLYWNCYVERYTSTVNIYGFLAALLIALLWLIYIRSFDIFQPEKWGPLVLTFLLSCALLFFVYPLSDFIDIYTGLRMRDSALGDFLYSVVAIGAVEELVKFIPWLLVLKLTKKINEPFDYILYASVSALGFAFMENMKYYESDSLQIISDRAITAVVFHMFAASVVAYAFVISKYRLTDRKQKVMVQAAGFMLAALFHGFYDFWLISEFGQAFSFITFLFMLGCMRVWMLMKNNTLNLSSLMGSGQRLNHQVIGDNLVLGLVIIGMFEYVVIALNYGSGAAGVELIASSTMVIFMGIYLMIEMSNIRIRKGYWNPISFQDFVPRFFFRSRVQGRTENEPVPEALRFFAPKSNAYVGDQFPVTGTLAGIVEISAEDWHLYQLDQSVSLNNHLVQQVAVRCKNNHNSLYDDKIEVIILFPKTPLQFSNPDLKTTDLMYVGSLYSRPI